jgi:glutaredoxin-like YruB-family protein
MKVTIYTTPECAYCKIAKEYFKEKKVAYKEVDVSKDEKNAGEMMKKSGQMSVPVIVVETSEGIEELVVGFDQSRIANLLGINE